MTTYAAFISYRHGGADARWARWLHRSLEAYRPPAPYTAAWRANRFFRDEEELAASADLGDTLRAALNASDALVVVCSPRTPESRWVAEEVNQFRALGRGDRVFVLLTAGEPADSFPTPLRDPGVPEPLAADVRDGRRTDALLRIVAALLKIPFDDLKRRDDERRRRRRAVLTAGVAALAVVFLGLALYAFRQADLAETRRVAAVQAEGREREQRIVADDLRGKEQVTRELAEERLARMLIDRGLADAAGGQVSVGLHRMARAADIAKLGSPLAEEAARLTAEWGRGLGFPLVTGEVRVTCAAISPDGRTAAVGDKRGRVTLWRTGEPPECLGTLDHDDETCVIEFSPNGETVAVAELHHKVSVWDVRRRKRVAYLEHVESGRPSPEQDLTNPATIRFHPSGTAVALSWPQSNALQLFRLPLGEPVANAVHFSHGVADHRYTTDGQRVVVIDYAGHRRLLYADTGAMAEQPTQAAGTTDSGGATLGPGPLRDTRYLRQTAAGAELREFKTGTLVGSRWGQLDAGQVAFSPDGQRLASAHGTTVRLSDAATGGPFRQAVTSGTLNQAVSTGARVTALAWSADGNRLAVGDAAGTTTMWNVARPMRSSPLLAHYPAGTPFRLAGAVVGLHVHPTRPWLLAAATGEVRWWSWEGNEPTPLPPAAEMLARSPDVGWQVEQTGHHPTAVRPATGERRPLTPPPNDRWVSVNRAVFVAPDRVVGMSKEGRLFCWDPTDGRVVARAETKRLTFSVLVRRPDVPEVLVAADDTETVYRFAVRGDKIEPVGEFSGAARGTVRAVYVADAGKRVIIVRRDRVDLIDPADGRRVATIPIREYPSATALHPSGQWLAVAGSVSPVVVLGVQDGRVVREFGGGAGASALAFSPDGAVLAASQREVYRTQPAVVSRWWVATGSPFPDLPGGDTDELAYDPSGRLTEGWAGKGAPTDSGGQAAFQ